MKIYLGLLLGFLSFSSWALVDAKKCPAKFEITYYDISRGPLTRTVMNNPIYKMAWDKIQETKKFEQIFKITSRTDTALCVYSNGINGALLQTNNGIDELVIPYKDELYFRTKVLSFSNDYIELAVDEDSKDIYTPIKEYDSDGGYNVVGELPVGKAQAVNIEELD